MPAPRANAYIGLILKDEGSDYSVYFPDFPGCITAGRTLEEARAFAEEALGLHIESMIEEGEQLPAPSSLDEVMADHENRDAVAILVPLRLARSRAARVNITMDERLLAQVDAAAAAKGTTRSGFLAAAARAATAAERRRGGRAPRRGRQAAKSHH